MRVSCSLRETRIYNFSTKETNVKCRHLELFGLLEVSGKCGICFWIAGALRLIAVGSQDNCRMKQRTIIYIIPLTNWFRGMNNIVFRGSSQMFCEICCTCNDNVTDFPLKRRNCFNLRAASGVTTDTLRYEQMREYSHLR